jgi:hypothetical protein
MMIAAVVVFSARILNNLSALRRLMIERWRARLLAQQQAASAQDISVQPLEQAK